MKEIILQINEKKFDYQAGYEIVTNKQLIQLSIDNQQDCCENFGYFLSEDDISQFIGTELLDIKITDTQRGNKELVEIYEGDIMFVDIITSIGVLQFVAYNEHNGYYGHSACVVSKQLNFETIL